MGDLEGKVAVVTGASSGIGRATAFLMGREGARVVLAARRESEGEAAAQQIRDDGGDAVFVKADVSLEADIERMTATAVQEYGRLDCAFNNAGDAGRSPDPWEERSVDVWDKTEAVNLRGYWLCMKYQIRQMLKNGGGSIVNNSSLAGLTAAPGEIYGATKHGVIGLTKTAARNYGRKGIRANAVCPGAIETPIIAEVPEDFRKRFTETIPLNRFGEDTEVAEAVVWLCSDKSSYVTATSLTVDGGVIENFAPLPPL